MDQSIRSTGLTAPGRWHRSTWPATGAVLLAEAGAAVSGLGTAALGGPHWAAATAALVVGGGALTRVRGTSGAEFVADRLAVRAAAGVRVEAAPYPGGGDIGVRRSGDGLTAFVRIAASTPHLVALLRQDDPAVPLSVLAGLLRHGDTPASRIDVLVSGGRVPGEPPNPRQRYRQLLGPVNRWASVDVLIGITIDPRACAAACLRRGGGPSGEGRVAALAAQRAIDLLRASGIDATVARPAEAARLDTSPPSGAEHLDPGILSRGGLGDLFRADAPGTVGATLRAGAGRGVLLGAWHSAVGSGDHPQRGDHEAAGAASALEYVHLPLSGAGQILGSDAAGEPVGVRLHGRGVRTVWAAVADDPARQLVERAVATGARVLVVTGRPAMWEPLVSWVGSPRHLWISGWRYPDPIAPLPTDYTVTVLDGTAIGLPPGSAEPAGTVWRVEQAGISPVSEADVVLSQPMPGMLTVRTDGGAATLRLVA
ncbi:type VII secretion protein EccE [Tsukamurella sp. NPDC003166]|uniref:type VII secretion protein EccE n=1 Tax=Tsukamurella sp. NPDC003166 TaxID=3154444 RepID=UPI0033BCBE54